MTDTGIKPVKKPLRFGFGKPDKEINASLIGEGTLLEGILNFHGLVRICGCFKGEIASTGKLFIDKTGLVVADIHVAEIVVGGEVHGNITADKKIEILKSGKVFGRIQASQTIVNHCAVFKGICRTGSSVKLPAPVIDINRPLAEKRKLEGGDGVLPEEAGKISAKKL